MTLTGLTTLTAQDAAWPVCLTERLGTAAPTMLQTSGPETLLANRMTALFCSASTPGSAILGAYDAARELRNQRMTVISGFHSPIEKGCLQILLRGTQPIIWCPARTIENQQIPKDLRPAFEANRILILSPFNNTIRRTNRASALRRNEIVAALCDEAVIAHITPGGQTETMVKQMQKWGVALRMTTDE